MEERKPPQSVRSQDLRFNIETEREDDGRWIAEIADIPGVIVYGETEEQAKRKAYALALRVIADRVEDDKESIPQQLNLTCISA